MLRDSLTPFYDAAISIGADGKCKIVTKIARTQADARRKLTELKGDQDAHRLVVTGKATVRNWLDAWLEAFVKPNRAPRTYASYHDVLEQHLPDRIGNMLLTRLAPEDLQRQFNAVAATGHPRTADLLRAVLRSSFNVIHVRRSLAWIKLPGDEQGRWIEREPKRGSFRDLPMMSVTGAPLHQRNVSEAFYKVCDRATVRHLRFHDTRHSCGTLLYVQGADPFMIQTVLGHSQLSTTRRYTRVPIQVTKAALDGLETLFDNARKKRESESEPPRKSPRVQ